MNVTATATDTFSPPRAVAAALHWLVFGWSVFCGASLLIWFRYHRLDARLPGARGVRLYDAPLGRTLAGAGPRGRGDRMGDGTRDRAVPAEGVDDRVPDRRHSERSSGGDRPCASRTDVTPGRALPPRERATRTFPSKEAPDPDLVRRDARRAATPPRPDSAPPQTLHPSASARGSSREPSARRYPCPPP